LRSKTAEPRYLRLPFQLRKAYETAPTVQNWVGKKVKKSVGRSPSNRLEGHKNAVPAQGGGDFRP
jgi:hypothetical protein